MDSNTPETNEAWDAVSRTPSGTYDSSVHMSEHSRKMERERDEARRIATEACAILAESNFEVNYPPMPWDDDSEND